jgi:hypothetical protein
MYRNKGELPSREEVMIQSSWKPSQQTGSVPTTLDFEVVSSRFNGPNAYEHYSELTMIGGSKAVRALGSTG